MRFTLDEIRSATIKLKPYVNMVMRRDQSEYAQIQMARDDVLSRYQPIFSSQNLPKLSADEYRSFLMFRNNQHWRSLQRMGPAQTANMDLLRKALTILLDENRPIKERLDLVLPQSGPLVPRFGAATITPILLIAYPDKYGVLNKPAEDGLRAIGLWPEFEKDTPFSEKYIEVNQIYLSLRDELGIDLWTLDTLWWAVLLEGSQSTNEIAYDEVLNEPVISTSDVQRFGLERYLQEFLRDNWETVPEFQDWALYEEDGDVVGFEYNTNEIGRIDLLAHHKREPLWLVVELKRNQSSDQTVGQVLRYIGWVEQNLKAEDENVRGLIISHDADSSINYALKHVPTVSLMLYDVKFSLRSV